MTTSAFIFQRLMSMAAVLVWGKPQASKACFAQFWNTSLVSLLARDNHPGPSTNVWPGSRSVCDVYGSAVECSYPAIEAVGVATFCGILAPCIDMTMHQLSQVPRRLAELVFERAREMVPTQKPELGGNVGNTPELSGVGQDGFNTFEPPRLNVALHTALLLEQSMERSSGLGQAGHPRQILEAAGHPQGLMD